MVWLGLRTVLALVVLAMVRVGGLWLLRLLLVVESVAPCSAASSSDVFFGPLPTLGRAELA